jgi:hypothetical protein
VTSASTASRGRRELMRLGVYSIPFGRQFENQFNRLGMTGELLPVK